MIVMQSRSCGACWNGDLRQTGFIGGEEPTAVTRDLNSAWDEIGFSRNDVAVPLDPSNLPGLLELLQLLL